MRCKIAVFSFGICALLIPTWGYASNGGVPAYNDVRIAQAVDIVMTYLEGSFGATIMAIAGILTIIMAAFGQYRAALSLLAVAAGAFCLRSFMATFFNDSTIVNAHQAVHGEQPYSVRALSDGIMISVPSEATVLAYENGTVKLVERNKDGSYRLVIAHEHGVSSEYDGLVGTAVKEAQIVSREEGIALVSPQNKSGTSQKKVVGLFFGLQKGGANLNMLEAFPDLVKGENDKILNAEWLIKRLLRMGETDNVPTGVSGAASHAEEF